MTLNKTKTTNPQQKKIKFMTCSIKKEKLGKDTLLRLPTNYIYRLKTNINRNRNKNKQLRRYKDRRRTQFN